MFLQRIERPRIKKDGTISLQPEVRYQFKCDECGMVYEKKPGNVSISKSGLHFCSNTCKFVSHRTGGKLASVNDETSLQRYGHTKPMRSEIIKTRHINTFQERYGEGVKCALQ